MTDPKPVRMWAVCVGDKGPITYKDIFPNKLKHVKLFATQKAANAEHARLQGMHGYAARLTVRRVTLTPDPESEKNE